MKQDTDLNTLADELFKITQDRITAIATSTSYFRLQDSNERQFKYIPGPGSSYFCQKNTSLVPGTILLDQGGNAHILLNLEELAGRDQLETLPIPHAVIIFQKVNKLDPVTKKSKETLEQVNFLVQCLQENKTFKFYRPASPAVGQVLNYKGAHYEVTAISTEGNVSTATVKTYVVSKND